VKGWKKIYQAHAHSPPPKQAGVAMLISGKVDFKHTLVKRDKEGHLILIKGEILKGNNNYQPICTQCQCTQFHHTHCEGPYKIYKLQHSGSEDFNTPGHQ
jgi:hypothetical protein